MMISSGENWWYYYYFISIVFNGIEIQTRNERSVIHRSFTARAFVSLGQKRAGKIRSPVDSPPKISAKTSEKQI